MKLQLSLIMMAALAFADDGEPAPEAEPAPKVQKPSVWNNWNGDPMNNMPNDADNEDYFKRREYFD